jgi:hypothetical protein
MASAASKMGSFAQLEIHTHKNTHRQISDLLPF